MKTGKLEAVGNLVRTSRDKNGIGGFLVAEVQMHRPDSHELAALIAVAPELLVALKQIDHYADIYHPETLRAIARAAIAKATGKA